MDDEYDFAAGLAASAAAYGSEATVASDTAVTVAPLDVAVTTPNCEDPPDPVLITERFILVSIFGTATAFLCIIENLTLSYVILKKRSHRSSHLLYLGLLAVCDVIIAFAYVPLMVVSNIADFTKSAPILIAWFHYMKALITISHIGMTTSTFLIVAATFERFVITVSPKRADDIRRYRVNIALSAVALGILCKFTMALELTTQHHPTCAGTLQEYSLQVSSLAKNTLYYTLWKFFFRNFFTVYLPFLILAYLNVHIVVVMKSEQAANDQKMKYETHEGRRKRTRVREATYTLLLVVFTYLLSNTLNVVVTIWEYLDFEGLNSFPSFYNIAVDLVSFLTVFTGCLRPPIYLFCQANLRREFAQLLKHACGRAEPSYRTSSCVPTADTIIHGDEESSSSRLLDSASPAHHNGLLTP